VKLGEAEAVLLQYNTGEERHWWHQAYAVGGVLALSITQAPCSLAFLAAEFCASFTAASWEHSGGKNARMVFRPSRSRSEVNILDVSLAFPFFTPMPMGCWRGVKGRGEI
jgi:hypothetical protein